MLYIMAISDAIGDAQDHVLENIAKYASSGTEFQGVLSARYPSSRGLYMVS